MEHLNNINDDEFVSFLHSMGVETNMKSFQWMDDGGVLRWLYDNLDRNNALTAREEYRYQELEKNGQLLSPEELETTVTSLQQEYKGICLPEDQEGVEDVKLDISMLKERLNVLEKQEVVLKDLIGQNDITKKKLTLELITLKSAIQQCDEDQTTAAKECISLAEEIGTVTDGVVDIIADTLNVYASCHGDQKTAKKFFTFGPFELYQQSQALFRSHFDLYTSRKFAKRQNDSVTDDELNFALLEAKGMEERLTDAIYAYIESRAEMSGEEAKLALVTNYNCVLPSQVTIQSMEAQSSLELLEEEEIILDRQIRDAVKELVNDRTRITVETSARLTLTIREQIHNDLTYLLDTTQHAAALDKLLYFALRHELRTVQEFLQFAAHLRQYIIEEDDAVISRIESMNEICTKQESCECKLQSLNVLTKTLFAILGEQPSNDYLKLIKLYDELRSKIKELKDCVYEGYKKKEEALIVSKMLTVPLREYIWDGCTKQPNCWDTVVSTLMHSLKEDMDRVDRKVIESTGMLTSIKNGDTRCLRKLWQWFLTDPNRLQSAVKCVSD